MAQLPPPPPADDTAQTAALLGEAQAAAAAAGPGHVSLTVEESALCPYCLEEEKGGLVPAPCACRGSLGLVHEACLRHDLAVRSRRFPPRKPC